MELTYRGDPITQRPLTTHCALLQHQLLLPWRPWHGADQHTDYWPIWEKNASRMDWVKLISSSNGWVKSNVFYALCLFFFKTVRKLLVKLTISLHFLRICLWKTHHHDARGCGRLPGYCYAFANMSEYLKHITEVVSDWSNSKEPRSLYNRYSDLWKWIVASSV